MKFLNKNNCEIKKQRGFTLIELLVVIAIIGILSSVVLASLNSARSKARDAQRIAGVKEIQKALEMYYNEKGYYPGGTGSVAYYFIQNTADSNGGPGCGPDNNWASNPQHKGTWCLLEDTLTPYLSKLPRDPMGNNNTYYFTYKYIYSGASTSGLGPDTYGLSVILENPNSTSKNDGGYYDNRFEVGFLPAYCKAKSGTGDSTDWASWESACVCGRSTNNTCSI
jgi:prepilin-type N-terminal cleavage/methylation domain-containing protein